MKLLASGLILVLFCTNPASRITFHNALLTDSTKWRLIHIETISAKGAYHSSIDMRNQKSMLYLRFVNARQVVYYIAFENYKADTGTYKKSKDTVFASRYRLGKLTTTDTFLVKKRNEDSLVLHQLSYRGMSILRFSSKDLEINTPHVEAGFYKEADKWRLISSKTVYKYSDARQSSSSMDMLSEVNKKNIVILFLSKKAGPESIAVRVSNFLSMHDTAYFSMHGNKLSPLSGKADDILITRRTTDSLTLLTTKTDPASTAVTTDQYASAKDWR